MSLEILSDYLMYNDFLSLKNYITKHTNDWEQKNDLWHFVIYRAIRLNPNKEMLELITNELYKINNILKFDDVYNLPKIENRDQAFNYFSQGKSQIKNFIINNYPQFIGRRYFRLAAQLNDLELLKNLTELYENKKQIDWIEIGCIYIKYSKQNEFNELLEFLNNQGLIVKENIQSFLWATCDNKDAMDYFIKKAAYINLDKHIK